MNKKKMKINSTSTKLPLRGKDTVTIRWYALDMRFCSLIRTNCSTDNAKGVGARGGVSLDIRDF